jgi:transcription initiation factor TFIIF subunit alpha
MKSMAPSPSPVRRAAPSPTPSAAPSPAPSQSEPEGPYQDFTLVSAGPDAWMYDIIKLEDRRTVDPQEWTGPVRLNRKDLRRAAADGDGEGPQAVGPMLGPDGKPVVGADGRTVMVDAEGRPIHPNAVPRGAGGRGRGGRRFQKKTRQVHLVPDELRQLRKEERYPWVLEDATGNENWVASMEEVAKAQTHALFMPMGHQFTFVPLHRWYKFQKKPTVGAPTLQEAEEMVWQAQRRGSTNTLTRRHR